MPYDTLPPAAAHRVELDGRERLIVSGVDDVDRFDENEIVMTTSAGTLIVTGESLHIGKLSPGRRRAPRRRPHRLAPL